MNTYLTIKDVDGEIKCFIYMDKISYVNFKADAAHIVMDNGHTNILQPCTSEHKTELLNMLKGNLGAQT